MPPRPAPKQQSFRRRGAELTNIEDKIRYAYFSPAPDTYHPKAVADISEPKPLGKISESRALSCHDHAPKSKSWVPGPGRYHGSNDFQLPEGGRVNRYPPVERLKFDEYPKPSPGEYGIPNDPTVPRHRFGKFGKDPKYTKFIRDEEMRTRSIPGPGAHEVQESIAAVKPFCPEGGRTLASSKPPGYFDYVPKQYESKPGPGQYEAKGSVNGNKATGRLVYRYESATIAESKSMVSKVSSHDPPGPGTYNLPDPPPLGQAPMLKGRGLGHAMPHPYAYNCAPDYARKYDIVPVRQENSADMIYGTGRKPKFTGAARGSRGGSQSSSDGSNRNSPSSTSKIQAPEIPGTAALDLNPEDAVQWRSGGFAPIRKAKSTGAIKRLNPVFEEFKQYYPALHSQNRDKSTFLPLQVKKNDAVSTHDDSAEYQRLQLGKFQVNAISERLGNCTDQALEPLDLDRLRQDAMEGLIAKARFRMHMEGVGKDQEELVIAEMRAVLQEKSGTVPRGEGGNVAVNGGDALDAALGNAADTGRLADSSMHSSTGVT